MRLDIKIYLAIFVLFTILIVVLQAINIKKLERINEQLVQDVENLIDNKNVYYELSNDENLFYENLGYQDTMFHVGRAENEYNIWWEKGNISIEVFFNSANNRSQLILIDKEREEFGEYP